MLRRSMSAAGPVSIQKRADEATPMIFGYAAVFYNPSDPGSQFELWDDVFERIMPNAFDRAIREDDVRALFNHDASAVLGRLASGTLRLSVDGKGLRYEIDPPDTQTGRDVLAMLQRGDVSGSSFAFNIRGDVVRRETTADGTEVYIRELTDVELFDVGPVTYPAYPSASSGASRSRTEADAVKHKAGRPNLARVNLLATSMAMLAGVDR